MKSSETKEKEENIWKGVLVSPVNRASRADQGLPGWISKALTGYGYLKTPERSTDCWKASHLGVLKSASTWK